MTRGFKWLLTATVFAFVAAVLVVSRRSGIPAPLVAATAPVAILILVFTVLVPFHLGSDLARRRRLRIRISRLRTALREGREGDIDAQLSRIVALNGAGDPFLRQWFRRPSYPFRERLLPVVGPNALYEVLRRRDDPLAPRAWLAWLGKQARLEPGVSLRTDLPDEELRRLWERADRNMPRLFPPELLNSRPPA